jgi:hypothetical protein
VLFCSLCCSPNFTHFFLDWVVKVANAAPGDAVEQRQQLLQEANSSQLAAV